MRPSAPPSVMAANRKKTPVSAALATSISSVPLGCLCGLGRLSGPLIALFGGTLGQLGVNRFLVNAGKHTGTGSIKPQVLASKAGHTIVFVGHEEGREATRFHAQTTEHTATEVNASRNDLVICGIEFSGGHGGFLAGIIPANGGRIARKVED